MMFGFVSASELLSRAKIAASATRKNRERRFIIPQDMVECSGEKVESLA
jgi:hypothetical protein